MDDQAERPQHARQNVERAEQYLEAHRYRHVIVKLRGRLVVGGRKKRQDVLSVDGDRNAEAASDDAWHLLRVYFSAVEEVVDDEGEDGAADVEDVDGGQRNHVVHGGVSDLVDQHDHAPDEQVLVVARALEIDIHAQIFGDQEVSEEDGYAATHVRLHCCEISLRNVDEAEWVDEACEDEEGVCEVVPSEFHAQPL